MNLYAEIFDIQCDSLLIYWLYQKILVETIYYSERVFGLSGSRPLVLISGPPAPGLQKF